MTITHNNKVPFFHPTFLPLHFLPGWMYKRSSERWWWWDVRALGSLAFEVNRTVGAVIRVKPWSTLMKHPYRLDGFDRYYPIQL